MSYTANKSDDAVMNFSGTVTVRRGRITVEGFDFDGATCRDAAIIGAAWAIGELQREMLMAIMKPGDNNIVVD